MKVKVIGAGSIGNHLSRACRKRGWDVTLTDKDKEALRRTKNEIYPNRYKEWDNEIKLMETKDAPKGGYDLIIIGTPPEYHIPLALEALDEKPKAILIEKPLCTPSLVNLDKLYRKSKKSDTKIFVGYNHNLSVITDVANRLLGKINKAEVLECYWQEHWGGIFEAHPWLSGPSDSYLGYLAHGGGATGEHSHGINIWQTFAHMLDEGEVVEVTATMNIVDGSYDKYSNITLKTKSGFVGHIIQDVVTKPPVKKVYVKGDNINLQWSLNDSTNADALYIGIGIYKHPKTREDDFNPEIAHINDILEGRVPYEKSPITLERGIETQVVISAAYKSHMYGKKVVIDWTKPFTPQMLD